MLRALNSLAFWLAVLGIALLTVWFSLEPLEFLQLSMTAQHVKWRGLANVGPLAVAVLAIMFTVPTAAGRAQDGKWRKGWTRLAFAYALALSLAFPGRWLLWSLLADF